MRENQKILLRRCENVGALRHGHFRLHSGKETDVFFNADELYARPGLFAYPIAMEIIQQLPADLQIEAIVGPKEGAIVLAQWLAIGLAHDRRRRNVIAMAVEEKDGHVTLTRDDLARLDRKKVLLVDDVLTTGGSLRAVVTRLGYPRPNCEILGAAVICNRGDVKLQELGAPFLISALEINAQVFEPHEVPDWLKAIPIDEELGQGPKSA